MARKPKLVDGISDREHARRLGMTYGAYRTEVWRQAKRKRLGLPAQTRKYRRIDAG